QMANPIVGTVSASAPPNPSYPTADGAALTNGRFSVHEPGTAADSHANAYAGGSMGGSLGPNSDDVSLTTSSTQAREDAVDMRSIEREHILQVLRTVNGSRRRAVELLGISERALRYKLKSYREEGHTVS
ncbi:MAG: hypothetical protein EBT08_20095, partial [Betaproteobacteria bacterium]|nr:hypothetical protein [Betaproteobacteria bacterium]